MKKRMQQDFPSYKSTLKWLNCIRSYFPTAIFYFSQNYDNTIVVYYVDTKTHTIQNISCTLSVDGIKDTKQLPKDVDEKYFKLCPGRSEGSYTIPGGFGEWRLSKNRTFTCDNKLLVNMTAILDTSTKKIEYFYRVYVNSATRTLEYEKLDCPEFLRNSISELAPSMFWSSIKNTIGV